MRHEKTLEILTDENFLEGWDLICSRIDRDIGLMKDSLENADGDFKAIQDKIKVLRSLKGYREDILSEIPKQ